MLEPDSAVLILNELTFHSNNFVLVEFRDVVADFVDLLQTISLLIMANEINVFSNGSEIVNYLIIYILSVDMSVKFDSDWRSYSDFGFNTCLNIVYLSPEGIYRFALEDDSKASPCHNLNRWCQLRHIDAIKSV